jgi:hypothetical protein
MKYEKIEGLDLEIQFVTKFLLKDGKWACDLTKRNMKQLYNDSGYSYVLSSVKALGASRAISQGEKGE